MRLAAVVHNPASGRRPTAALAERVAAVLREELAEVRMLPTARAGHAAELVEALLREQAGREVDVVSLGGDGTLNEVLHGMLRAGALPGDGSCRVAVLPGGTTNVVARCLGMPRDPVEAVRSIRSGRTRRIDVGACRVHAQVHPFVLACGIGVDAEALALVTPAQKRAFGWIAYLAGAVRASGARDRGLVAELDLADGSRESVACASAVVATSERYAGRLRLRRGALPDDGLLEVALLRSTRLHHLVASGLCATVVDMAASSNARVVQARAVRLSAAVAVPLHVDAEPAGMLPAEITIRPLALTVRVPG